ncbi:MAG: tetratricopeptide repeat protein, partial [Oscillospiraceae bacterium]|nr:tetratricopeptide repeat protein [Oscillospiraceae bacterium]
GVLILYRKSGEKKKGIVAIYSAFKLIEDLGLEGTATAGTVWVNGGTTLRAFNMSTDALPYFYMASRAYSANIPADDYRFAGLYNNLGSCLEALNKNEEALKYYELALAVVKQNPLTEIDAAITWINMAEVYDKMEPRDEEKIEECVNNCMAIFNNPKIERDEYYSFHAKGCAGGLKSLGYFRDARELKKRAEDIDHALS